MSGFAVIYERSNTPVDPGALERVMERLSHRGPDGRDICLTEHIALGHWHFWITPEEVGERQPLELTGLPFKIVLDGRLDNRTELISNLNINALEGSRLSDAALVLHAYEHWREHCFEHFIGEFALVIVDEQSGELVCARDALGDRTLYYSCTGSRMVVASEAWAVAGVDGSEIKMNEKAAAFYFALKATEDGQSLFDTVYELLPAHAMRVNTSNERRWRYWQPDPSIQLNGRTDREYAEEFRSLLEESVRCRLRSTTPVGVLMSGGLDSTSVACLAARMLKPQALTTISYVFDELLDCDERQYIEAVQEKWDIHSIQIPCDDAWPYKDWPKGLFDPNQPDPNPFYWPEERAFTRAGQEGLRVLLTGGFGDYLYAEGVNCLVDLLREKRFQDILRELEILLRSVGIRRTWNAGFLQRLVRYVFRVPAGMSFHAHSSNAPAWVSSFTTGFLNQDMDDIDIHSEQQVNLIGNATAQGCISVGIQASRHGLDLRHPYRDRRLIEYVLSLPAHQLYQHGLYKHILRQAMHGILPESIRTRRIPTAFNSLFLRGVEREEELIQNCIRDPKAAWRRFVQPDWLVNHSKFVPGQSGMDFFVPWVCISYDLWCRRITSGNSTT